jgi:hypothetical protein
METIKNIATLLTNAVISIVGIFIIVLGITWVVFQRYGIAMEDIIGLSIFFMGFFVAIIIFTLGIAVILWFFNLI